MKIFFNLKGNKDIKKLFKSLFFNIVAKLPGLYGTFIFLPIIAINLGSKDYSSMMQLLSLGGVFTFIYGGINTVSRRRMSISLSSATDEENIINKNFSLSIMVSFYFLIITSFLIITFIYYQKLSLTYSIIAILPILASTANIFDNIRSSYNEHYVTAILQTITQTIFYLVAYCFFMKSQNSILLAFIIQGSYIIASLLTGALLVKDKSLKIIPIDYKNIKAFITEAFPVSFSDGILFLVINLSIFWLGTTSEHDLTTWFSTFSRMFITLLSPIMLIILPITGFIGFKWANFSKEKKKATLTAFSLFSLIYGIITFFTLWLIVSDYIMNSIKLINNIPEIAVIGASLLFSSIIAIKSYSLLIFSIYRGLFISININIIIVTLVISAVIANNYLNITTFGLLENFCIICGIMLYLTILIDSIKRINVLQDHYKN